MECAYFANGKCQLGRKECPCPEKLTTKTMLEILLKELKSE